MKPVTFRESLATRERLGWALYDWANSAFVLCVITVIGSAYFVALFEARAKEVGSLQVGGVSALRVLGLDLTAEAAWSFIIAAAALYVALSSPLLGALADARGNKKRMLFGYCLLGVLCTLALSLPAAWWVVGLLILLANIGFEGGNVFYNAFLPEIAPVEARDKLSSVGYAFGYAGGVLVLIASLFLFILPREAVRPTFVLVGLWWGGFALFAFFWLQERPGGNPAQSTLASLGTAWAELKKTLSHIAKTPQAAKFLLAFLCYNDGVATLISNATPYALQNIYLDESLTQKITLKELIPAIIMIQIIAVPGSLFCGWLATRSSEKSAIFFTLSVFTVVVAYGQVAQLLREFYIMAALIGLVLGGAQAISRALFASLVPQGKSAEYFAFFALSSKFSAMFGPLVYGVLLLITGNTRLALLSLTVFFVLGAALLAWVNVPQGRQEARAYAQ